MTNCFKTNGHVLARAVSAQAHLVTQESWRGPSIYAEVLKKITEVIDRPVKSR